MFTSIVGSLMGSSVGTPMLSRVTVLCLLSIGPVRGKPHLCTVSPACVLVREEVYIYIYPISHLLVVYTSSFTLVWQIEVQGHIHKSLSHLYDLWPSHVTFISAPIPHSTHSSCNIWLNQFVVHSHELVTNLYVTSDLYITFDPSTRLQTTPDPCTKPDNSSLWHLTYDPHETSEQIILHAMFAMAYNYPFIPSNPWLPPSSKRLIWVVKDSSE